jgi:hypothetical protein
MTMIRRALALLAAASLAGAARTEPVPRAADGHPDLSGVWSNASITRLNRMPGADKLVVDAAAAQALAKRDVLVRRAESEAGPTMTQEAPAYNADPQGYNAFWLDPGSALASVKGQFRTSWIVDPPDGRLPLSPAGRKLIAAHQARHDSARPPSDPEALEPWDRCIIGSRGSGGPGMLNNIYNSNYQIVQTPAAVAIVVEMIHDVRTVPLFPDAAAARAAHRPQPLQPWLGDSVGWWDGPTLVVETTNVNPQEGEAGPIFLSPNARVTERLTRVSARQILYEFQVDDPAYYSQPWRAEMSLNAGPAQIYEYACHEGNYALKDIMSGARAQEAKTATTGGR